MTNAVRKSRSLLPFIASKCLSLILTIQVYQLAMVQGGSFLSPYIVHALKLRIRPVNHPWSPYMGISTKGRIRKGISEHSICTDQPAWILPPV